MLVFIHMPKTGGTSLGRILRDTFPRILEVTDHTGVNRFLALPQEERDSYPLALGHMPFGIDMYVNVPCQYFVFLREPIDHMTSAYHYVLRTPDNPQHERAKTMTLFEYATSEAWALNDNQQTRRLATYDWTKAIPGSPSWINRRTPCDQALLNQAIANVERCEFIGLHENFDADVIACCATFGIPCDLVPAENVTPNRGAPDLSADEYQLLRERLKYDYALYEHAKNLKRRRGAGVSAGTN